MVEKLFDVANKLKAKIGGDELDQKLVEATSEQNWQASTSLLHEIANAAYNYQKWQKISDFIWDKLKKSKSWRKILKALNLVEFLLKNGPSSIIPNFKYDIYQFRTFDNYSHFSEGKDRGEPIRQKAKMIVELLNNEELLEEERIKSKNIREKMSGIVGSSPYGGVGSDSKGGKYDSFDSKKFNKSGNSSYAGNYGNETGHYGDYNTQKSTLDKYKKQDKTLSNSSGTKPVAVVEEPVVKKPFGEQLRKLSKPTDVQKTASQVKPQGQQPAANESLLDFDTPVPVAPKAPVVEAPRPQPPPVQGLNFTVPNQPTQATQVPQVPQLIQPPQINLIPQGLNLGQNNPYGAQQPYGQPNFNGQQFGGQPPQNQFPQLGGVNFGNNYPQQQQQNYPQQQQNYPQQQQNYPQQQQNYPQQQQNYPQQQQNYPQQQQNFNFGNQPQPQQFGGNYINPMYAQTAPMAANSMNVPFQGISLNMGVSTKKKDEDQFGGFQSGEKQSVKWLSSEEKGLVDFTNFGAQINQKDKKGAGKSMQLSNNIQIDTWNW